MLRIVIMPFCSLRVDHVLSILLLQSLLCSDLQGLQVFFLKVFLVDRQVLLHPFAEHHRVEATDNPLAPINGNSPFSRRTINCSIVVAW